MPADQLLRAARPAAAQSTGAVHLGAAVQPASLPEAGLPGLEPHWSRLVTTPDVDGMHRTWHVLDNVDDLPADRPVAGTVLCVHGNPTWSYLWRDVLRRAAQAEQPWRVVAVDHLDMGWSERTGTVRPLARRVADLTAVVGALDLPGPLVLLAHDWGGPIGLGWALEHRDQLGGIVLTNTAVHQPDDAAMPRVLQLARTPGLLRAATVRTPTFLLGTLATARTPLDAARRHAYLAPYRTAVRRAAIGDFVADIPVGAGHPSVPVLDRIADGVRGLTDVPALLLWGPDDPVFADRYLHDLMTRLPHAAVHRFEGAGHLLAEDADVAGAVVRWLDETFREPSAPQGEPVTDPSSAAPPARQPLWAALAERAEDSATAVVEMAPPGATGPRRISWARLHQRVQELAVGLDAHGVRRGDRVGLLVPPGAELTALLYACVRIGAVVVVADAGLGLGGMRRALRGARPDHLIGIPRALAAARALGWPGRRIVAGPVPGALVRTIGAQTSVRDLARRGARLLRAGVELPPEPDADAAAAVLFTSGSTGPAKGVLYRHRHLEAQRDVFAAAYGIGPGDRLVAGFAPFALYGPALGIPSAVPDMDVTAPRTLTAAALADAAAAVEATLVFTSPASLRNVVETADLTAQHRAALGGVRLLLSAGAPVPASLLADAAALLPNAELHTPYGMTEALLVTDIGLTEIQEVAATAGRAGGVGRGEDVGGDDDADGRGEPADGVCVGRPLPGVELAVLPLDETGTPGGDLTTRPGTTGEVCVRADHVKDHYDRLWHTERRSRVGRWHRTGDVGHLDGRGRLWIEGRLQHVIVTAAGVLTPVGPEQRAEQVPGVTRAAVVGVGPVGTQQVVVVVETDPPTPRTRLAQTDLAAAVRVAVAGSRRAVTPAAVLAVPALPVDVRHNSKIDRVQVARDAATYLAGRR